jgi:hypothetical protein
VLTRITRLFAAPVTASPKSARRTRLSVEALEDRAVPASWTAATVSELIQYMKEANDAPGPDDITLVAGATYTLTAVNNTTHGWTGLPVATGGDGLTIVGNGATVERSTAAGTPAFRLLDVAAGASLTLQNLALQGGLTLGYWSVAASGGAISNAGNLTLDGVTVQNNTAQGGSGDWVGVQGHDAAGGGVYSSGNLKMTGCTIENNRAIGGRGSDGYVPDGQVYGKKGPFSLPGKDGGNGFGGGVYIASGTATVTTCTITANLAQGGAGGNGVLDPLAPSQAGNGGNGFGGGLYVAGGTVALHSVTVALNVARGGAGGAGARTALEGHPGKGFGGGIYIDAAASVGLDGFTKDHVLNNTASSTKNNIAGSYGPI